MGPLHVWLRGPVSPSFQHDAMAERSQVNLRKLAVEPVKVDQVARALCLPAANMHDFTSGKRLFDLELTL